MADAYKLKADASFPSPLVEDEEGNATEVVGRTYNAGDYVMASELTKSVREKADAGDLDHLLEEASADDAEKSRAGGFRPVRIPEHEAEAVVFMESGQVEVVPRDQAIELNSAGAEGAREAMEAAKSEGADERPALTAAEVPSLTAVAQGESPSDLGVVPLESERVDEEKLAGVEQPPGLIVGPDQAAAAGGSSEEPKKRGRPQRQEKAVAAKEQEKAAAKKSEGQ